MERMQRMKGLATRLKFQVEDFLRFSTAARTLTSHWIQTQAMRLPCGDDQQRILRIQRLCSAATLTRDLDHRGRLEALIRESADEIDGRDIHWHMAYPYVGDRKIHSAALLKPWVSPRERGVLLISFERQWIKLLHFHCADEVRERYILVLGPSWTPPHSLGVTVFPKLYPDRMLSTISHDNDMETLPRLSPRIAPVALLASNWVLPEDFSPLPHSQRDVDIVMVATFGKYKRHHALLGALRRMPRTVRVLLIGTNGELDAEGIRALARSFGVENMLVDVRTEDYRGTARAFCRARISVMMSKREGSCQAVVESMFADTPVGILENAELGSRKYVNPHTGGLLRESHLAEDIMTLLGRSGSMAPRQWVVEHDLCCRSSTRVLNEAIRRFAIDSGEEWTRDIVLHAWNPYPEVVQPEDRESLWPAYRDFKSRYGITLGLAPGRWE